MLDGSYDGTPLVSIRWTLVDWAPDIRLSEFFLVEADIFAFVLPVRPQTWLMTSTRRRKIVPGDSHAFPTVMQFHALLGAGTQAGVLLMQGA